MEITPKTVGLGLLDEYKILLESFKNNGYAFVFFKELFALQNQVALRHDIDFDMNAALVMAKLEQELNIKSSYFFLLSNHNFNLLVPENVHIIREIKKLGHVVSLQFDPSNYAQEKELEMLEWEIKLFENIADTEIEIISFHRPSFSAMNSEKWLPNIEHTYLKKYTENAYYHSDSKGLWRFGHPLETQAFLEQKSMQLLIHPIWWIVDGKTNEEKIWHTYEINAEKLKQNYADNNIIFQELLAKKQPKN